jgi:3'(2'), 5'-bisphosphate nucleotidase
MRGFDFNPVSERLWSIGQMAAEAIAQVVEHAVRFKPDDSPVTAADWAAHAVLARELPLVLNLPVVSEETQDCEAKIPCNKTTYWLVDPLDGTKEFIAGNDDFVVCIALMAEALPVLGFIYQPRTQTAYWGGAHWGSFRRVGTGVIEAIKTRRANFDEPLIAWVSRQGAQAEAPWMEQLSRHWPSGVLQRPLGSALKACLLASGAGDLYPRRGRTCIWDTAAAQAILQGAGGDFLTLSGQPLAYGQQSGLYNPEFIAVADKTLPWLELLGIKY